MARLLGTRPSEYRPMLLAGILLGLAFAQYGGDIAIPDATTEASGSAVSFSLCHSGGGTNCVVDGDTFYLQGEKIRIADIDTPETHPPRCAEEAVLGERATLRLRALLNEGEFTLGSIDRDEDRYGRKLRTVLRDGESLGDVLVGEGLARPYAGGRRPWCAKGEIAASYPARAAPSPGTMRASM